MAISEDEYPLLGVAVVLAQRVEFAIYGLAAHFPEQGDNLLKKRLSTTTPEEFLRGDVSKLTITLGQLAKGFAPALGLDPNLVESFVKDRNTVIHNYYRVFYMNIGGAAKPTQQPMQFLLSFIEQAARLELELSGLMFEIRVAAANAMGLPEKAPLPSEREGFDKRYAELMSVVNARRGSL